MAWEDDTVITALARLQRVAQRKVLGGRGTRAGKGGSVPFSIHLTMSLRQVSNASSRGSSHDSDGRSFGGDYEQAMSEG